MKIPKKTRGFIVGALLLGVISLIAVVVVINNKNEPRFLFPAPQGGQNVYIYENGDIVDIPGLQDTYTIDATIEATTKGYLYPAKKDGLWGYINTKGEWIIEPQYLYVLPFHDDVAQVATAETAFAYINTKGDILLEWSSPEQVGVFQNGKAIKYFESADEKICISIIDLQGETLAANIWADKASSKKLMYDSLFFERLAFSEDRLCICVDKKYGYLDAKGEWIVPPLYDTAEDFSEGVAAVSQNGKYGYIDLSGNIKIPLQYDGALPFSEGLAAVKENDRWHFIRSNGEDAFPGEYIKLPASAYKSLVFHEGICNVITEWWNYIDSQGNVLWDMDFTGAYPFQHGLALVSTGDKHGYINKAGEWIFSWSLY